LTDSDPLVALRQTLASVASPAPESPTPECLDDDAIAALAEGTLESGQRVAMLPHLAGCARCRIAVASVARALADPLVRRAVRTAQRGGAHRIRRLALVALPVAAALLLIVARWGTNFGPPVHRAAAVAAAQTPEPASPIGLVREAGELRWVLVAGADRYRVTLFDARPRVLYETEVVGSVAPLPDSVTLVPGARYLWKVEARIELDRWVASGLTEFSVAREPPR
jgi:hypothetical protein